MKKILYCEITLYELHQSIYLIDLNNSSDGQKIGLASRDNLVEEILYLSNKYEVNDIYLFGNETYLAPIVETLKENGLTKFNKNLNIEVNNKCLNI